MKPRFKHRRVILLALDPSSTCTGYAVFDSDRLDECGLLKPSASHGAERRTAMIVDDLRELLEAIEPTDIVIEVPSRGRGTGSAKGATGRLAIYGMAVGEIRRVCKDWTNSDGTKPTIHSVVERTWTKGRSKAKRQRQLSMLYPKHTAALVENDRGGDAFDAIGVGAYWLANRKLEEVTR